MFASEERTVDAMKEWLAGSGIGPRRISLSQNKGWLAFDATAEEAENLLHAEYHFYEHRPLGHMTPACERCHSSSKE
jgi:tripeptidyl-peptidase-1